MFSQLFFKPTICLILLLNRLISCQPLAAEEEEEHLDNRLKHYLKRLTLVAQETNNQFSTELQDLMEKFKHSLAKDTFKEKSLFFEHHTKNLEFAEFLSTEFDKQHINEDILIETWYLNEIAPYVGKDLYDEVIKIIHDLKDAYLTEDLEKKYDIYADIGEYVSDKFLDYFYGEDVPLPLLNAQLKYYYEYLQYLLTECQLCGEFEKDIQNLMLQVETAKASDNKAEKETVVNLFDNLTTKFGRYLDENFVDFKMFKFGE